MTVGIEFRAPALTSAAIIAALGYTPVNRAGDTMTGALTPATDDAAALGSASLSWSDLFIASGGVINFANGNFTVTHSAGNLAFSSTGNATFTTTGTSGARKVIDFNGVNSAPAANDEIYTSYLLTNSTSAQIESARQGTRMTTVTASSEESQFRWLVRAAGSLTTKLILSSSALGPGANDNLALGSASVSFSDLYLATGALINFGNGNYTITHSAGLLTLAGGPLYFLSGTAIPANGTTGVGLRMSSTANFGVFFGSGAPTLSAAKGSLYLRSDGSGTGDRAYINTDSGTTWTALTTAA